MGDTPKVADWAEVALVFVLCLQADMREWSWWRVGLFAVTLITLSHVVDYRARKESRDAG